MSERVLNGDFITEFGKIAMSYNNKSIIGVATTLNFFDKVTQFSGSSNNRLAGFLMGLNTTQDIGPETHGLEIWDMVNGVCKLRENNIVMLGGKETASAFKQIASLNVSQCRMNRDINLAYRLDVDKCVGSINKLVFMGTAGNMEDTLESYLRHLTSAVAYRIEKKSSAYTGTLTLGPKDKTGRYLYAGNTIYKYDGADLILRSDLKYATGSHVIQDKYCFSWDSGDLAIYSMETGLVVGTKTLAMPTSNLEVPLKYQSISKNNIVYDCTTGNIKIFATASTYRGYEKALCYFEITNASSEVITPAIIYEDNTKAECGFSGDVMKIGDTYYFSIKNVAGFGTSSQSYALASAKSIGTDGRNFNSVQVIGYASYSNASFSGVTLINDGGTATCFGFDYGYIQTCKIGHEIGNIFSAATPSESIVKKAPDIFDINYTFTG